MGTILAKHVVGRAQTIIQDRTGVRWPVNELLEWFNEGQRQVVLLRPDASAVTEAVHLVAGSKQAVPAGGWRMLDVHRNLGIDGSTPGEPITLCERNILDTQLRGWHFQSPAAAALHWVYEDRMPLVWWVFPCQPGNGQGWAEISYSKTPTACRIDGVVNESGDPGTVDDPISLTDVYEPALIDFIVYRAYCKNQAYVQQGLDMQYWNKFLTSLGLKTEVDKAFTPKRNAPPAVNKNVPYDTGAFGSQ